MKKIDKIKQKLGHFLLRRNVSAVKRNKAFHNFDSAKTVGVIFNATKQESYLLAISFIEFLTSKNIEVLALGYGLTSEAIGYFRYRAGINFYTLDKTNWQGKPLDKSFDEFVQVPFDMLIDISLADIYSIYYIIGMSKAKCKIAASGFLLNFADLIIDVKNNRSPEFFIEQLKHYMLAISKK